MKKKLEKCLEKNTFRKIMSANQNGLWLIMSNETILKLINLIIDNEERENYYEGRKQGNDIQHTRGYWDSGLHEQQL